MTDEELIKRLREGQDLHVLAAERIEALAKDRDEQRLWKVEWMYKAEAAEAHLAKAVDALREIGGEASVTVHTWRNGINFKKLYEGWRKIATQRIDRARAVLAEIGGGA